MVQPNTWMVIPNQSLISLSIFLKVYNLSNVLLVDWFSTVCLENEDSVENKDKKKAVGKRDDL